VPNAPFPKPVCIVVSPLIVVLTSCNNWLQDSMQIDEEKSYGSSEEQFHQKRISQLFWRFELPRACWFFAMIKQSEDLG
jgi:hypothetical protein